MSEPTNLGARRIIVAEEIVIEETMLGGDETDAGLKGVGYLKPVVGIAVELNPLIIFSGIAKVPGRYLCICLVFLVVLAVQRGGELVLAYSPVPLLPTVIAIFLSLYGLAVEMRLLGLLYYTNRDRFAWFQ